MRGSPPLTSRAEKMSGLNTTPIQPPAVPRAERHRCLISRHSFREARGIGSAGLKGYNLGGLG